MPTNHDGHEPATKGDIDKLARDTQTEFIGINRELTTIRSEMATKDDLRESEKRVIHAIKALDLKYDVEHLKEDVADLKARLLAVEKREGIKH